jgi:hypothetical protein
MPLDEEFERIVGWFARHTGGVDHLRSDHATTEAMIARAEYELDQLRRDVAEVKLDPEPIARKVA